MERNCLLFDDRFCDECGECSHCDLDPDRLCDSCMRCLRSGADYAAIEIEGILDEFDDDDEYPR